MTARRRSATLTIMLGCWLLACDNSSSKAPSGMGGGSGGSKPTKDAGSEEVEDGGEAGTPGEDAGPPPICVTDVFELSADSIARYRPVSLAPDAAGFTIAWHEWSDRDRLHLTRIPTTGQPGELTLLEVKNASNASYQNPVLAPGMVVFKSDLLSLDQRELMAQPLDSSFTPVGSPVRLTNDNVEQSVPQLVSVATGFVLVYSEPEDAGTRLIARTLSSQGVVGTANEIARSKAPLGGFSATAFKDGIGVSWVESTATGGDVWIRHVKTNGVPDGDASIVSTEGNAAGGIWMVSDDAAALVVFNVLLSGRRSEVRARLLALDGKPSQPERIVTFGPTQAAGVSATAYAGGFAVAYRARDAIATETRISFIHGSTGDIVSTHVAGATSAMDESTALAVSPDGTLLVAWSDIAPPASLDEEGGTLIKASRITCPEAWLRCSRK